jgi:hypothetical protein
MAKTKQDRVETVMNGGGHVVILGAGASIASTFRNPEVNGKKLPSMDNFIELVGLEDIIDKIDDNLRASNFETLYTNLHKANPNSSEIKEIERRVSEYFSDMALPNEPTIYDYLILALRPKDIIATFNWDPFLYQAYVRNHGLGEPPYLSFLHGNVAIGYSSTDKRSGAAGMISKETSNYYEPTKLLYPIEQKNYNSNQFISIEWARLKHFISSDTTKRLTIFGYGAPVSDVEAVKLLNSAWGSSDQRNMEQVEIIDVRNEDDIRETWKGFIHSHHYDYVNDYFNSSLALNPRRTSEAYFQHITPMSPGEMFSADNPVPKTFKTLKELQDWHLELIKAEEEHNTK